MNALTKIASVLALGAAASTPAVATEGGGVVLGAGLSGAHLSPRHVGGSESGVGLDLSAGYEFGPRWAALMRTSGARLDNASGDSYTLGHLDVLAQYRFRGDGRRVQLHVEGGLTRRNAQFGRATDDTVATRRQAGWGPTLGAGVKYQTRPSLALQATLHHTLGEFSSEECSSRGERVQTCATSSRLSLGFNWYPGRH